MTKREIRRRLKEYFGTVPNRILLGTLKGCTLVDIEYEDFRSEPRVKEELRQMLGEEVRINVKRECSPTLMRKVYRLLYGNINDLRFHLMETVE